MKRAEVVDQVFMEDLHDSMSIDRLKKEMAFSEQNGLSTDYEHQKRCLNALQKNGNERKSFMLRMIDIEEPYRRRVTLFGCLAAGSMGVAFGVIVAWFLFLVI